MCFILFELERPEREREREREREGRDLGPLERKNKSLERQTSK